jgi:GNAT superfamily N-acetyltransferase
MQEAGLATCLVAWRGGELAGRCTVLAASKYDKVRQVLGAFPEMNALEARPPGQGTGTKMIACAERTAGEHGAAMNGLAVAVSNDSAHRLYQRLGYHDWGHGLVLDHWGRN